MLTFDADIAMICLTKALALIADKTQGTKAMKCKNWSIERKRELLDSFKGKYVHIEFLKADKSLRVATVQHMQHAMFAEGHASKAHESTVAYKPQFYSCVDVNKKGWINCNLLTLKRVKCGEIDMTFDEE